ncbi:MAG: signal peptide peptidase SppA, partial [Candidatus Altiarchaeales archaeon]|nr:signal peptide peptidase SppA [Candidatus Altiarchaeales archaeon]
LTSITCILLIIAGVAFTLSQLSVIKELPIIGEKIMVISIRGGITSEECSRDLLGGSSKCTSVGEIRRKLENAEGDGTVRAVILDINSGGGSVVASREMMRAVRGFRKPIVARIGEVGASGAYYVASATDKIIADADSLTGSIGVVMTVQHYYGLYEKLGINVTVIKAGESKDIGSPYREMTEEEKGELKEMIDKIYYDFVRDVSVNRNLSFSYVENISDGSIYLGSEARELGLVDYLGGMDKAIEVASELGGIRGTPSVKREETMRTLIDIFPYMREYILKLILDGGS